MLRAEFECGYTSLKRNVRRFSAVAWEITKVRKTAANFVSRFKISVTESFDNSSTARFASVGPFSQVQGHFGGPARDPQVTSAEGVSLP
jgi:hypothetical protein